MEKVDGWLCEAGRDRASLGIEVRLNATDGTLDNWRKTVEQWRGLGASHLLVGTSGASQRRGSSHPAAAGGPTDPGRLSVQDDP